MVFREKMAAPGYRTVLLHNDFKFISLARVVFRYRSAPELLSAGAPVAHLDAI